MLFQRQQSYPWLRDWALSEAMIMLGRNRAKFATLRTTGYILYGW
ncbi:UNVERIFIED_ORG: hypothetical protein [Escherichia phage CMSTMSU]